MFISTRGLVVRSVRYRDADSMLTVLTDRLGKITVKARGANRKNSAFLSSVQLFAFSDMVLFEKGGRYTLNEAHTTEQFEGLRQDLARMAAASYFAEVLADCEEEAEAGEDILRLALNVLYAAASGKYPLPQVKAAFELRYVSLSGYMPQLDVCAGCGKELLSGYADAEDGAVYCEGCRSGHASFLPAGALSAARHVTSCELKKILSFPWNDETARIAGFAEKYLKTCLERGFKTLDFYHGIDPGAQTPGSGDIK